MGIYNRIYELCLKEGITGKELGEKLGLKKSPLTDWKNLKAKPTVDQIIAMCDIFATTSEYLLFGKESKELTTEEQKLLDAYRSAAPAIQTATRKLLDLPEPEPERSSILETG